MEDSDEFYYDAVDWEAVIERKEEELKSMAEELSRQMKAATEAKNIMARRHDAEMEKIKNESLKKEEEMQRKMRDKDDEIKEKKGR